MLQTADYLSIWEIGHRWHNVDPNLTDPRRLPLDVQDSLRMLTRAVWDEALHVVNSNGITYQNHSDQPRPWEYIPHKLLRVAEETVEEDTDQGIRHKRLRLERITPEEAGVSHDEIDEVQEYADFVARNTRRHDEAAYGLDQCFQERVYDKPKLESIFLDRYELIEFCAKYELDPPGFWYSESDKQELAGNAAPPERRLRPNQLDRELCRAVARTLWDIAPATNITEMCRHKAIKRYGNGAQYQEKTIRTWIADLDPRPAEAKRGRPPETES